jgi:hypothetical protein
MVEGTLQQRKEAFRSGAQKTGPLLTMTDR